MIIRPYLVVPRLIPQPTWGGTYIADFKGLSQAQIQALRVGQSYELCSESTLSTTMRSVELPIEIGNASDGSVQEIIGKQDGSFSLRFLIREDPSKVLGKAVINKHGQEMRVLIKFTQAKGNSFQVHVRPGEQVEGWQPKPESWYFFDKGKVTLGLKKPIDLAGYKEACLAIEAEAKRIAREISEKKVDVIQGRQQLGAFINTHSPFLFVNQVTVEQSTVVDLAAGGIHHSWEEGDEIPNGNIVYEVQLNVMDKDCTLRSFDKGKIGDDGSIRDVHIDDYFRAIDSDEGRNDPQQYMHVPMLHSEGGISRARLFETYHYASELLSFSGEYRGAHTTTSEESSFHHLFVKEGSVELQFGEHMFHLGKGASLFIPACTGAYVIRSNQKALLIKTWVD